MERPAILVSIRHWNEMDVWYGYSDGAVGGGSGPLDKYRGVRVWEVISQEERTTGLFIVIKATSQQGMRILNTYSAGKLVSSDTTILPDSWTVFGILIGPETIAPDWASTVPWAASPAGELPMSFSRRLSKPGDTVFVYGSSGFSNAFYADSVGLYSYGKGHINLGYGTSESLILTRFTRPTQ